MWYFKVKKIKEQAIVPSKRQEDAWYDLYWIYENDYKIFNPWDIFLISIWIAIEIPQNKVFYICERSSTWSKWIARRSWIIDSWYRWEIFVALNNTSNKTIVFYKQDDTKLDEFLKENLLTRENVVLYPQSKAIAQAMILDAYDYEVELVDELSDSQRWTWTLWSTSK